MSDIVERLREHADRIAGGGPSDSTYDPETLDVEHEAADEIERLRAELAKAQDPTRLKIAVCEAIIRLNGDDPIVPPTAINWIGDAIVNAVLEADDE